VQVVDNGPAAELDDGSVRAGHVCTDQSHQMLARLVSNVFRPVFRNFSSVLAIAFCSFSPSISASVDTSRQRCSCSAVLLLVVVVDYHSADFGGL